MLGCGGLTCLDDEIDGEGAYPQHARGCEDALDEPDSRHRRDARGNRQEQDGPGAENASPATIASVRPPGLRSCTLAVQPGSDSRQGISGKELPRASAEKASIHGAPAAIVPPPASAGRRPKTAKPKVPRAPSAKQTMGNHACGAVLACMSLMV